MRLARKIVAALWRTACVVAWCLLGLWTAGALFYKVLLSTWPAALMALGKGDKVYVSTVRDYVWRTESDTTPGYRDRVYDVNALSSMYFVLSAFYLEPMAHVWVGFGCSDGQQVAVSVEAQVVTRQAFRIDEAMRQVPLDEHFSERLREVLKRQGADNVPP